MSLSAAGARTPFNHFYHFFYNQVDFILSGIVFCWITQGKKHMKENV